MQANKLPAKFPRIPLKQILNPESEQGEMLRRIERTQTLTAKGKELQAERLKQVNSRYRMIYEKWRYNARLSKEMLSGEVSEEELKELIKNVGNTCAEVKLVYEELRRLQTPETDLRRRVDTCQEKEKSQNCKF